MIDSRFGRRRLLQGAAAASAASLPLLRALEGTARAQSTGTFKNFICLYHPHGVAAEFWAMRSGETETNFSINYADCALSPFDDARTYGKSFKDRLLVIEGLDLLSNANGHDTAGTILTGSRIDGKKPLNASLDQVLAVDHGLGKASPVTSISLGVGNDVSEAGSTLSFGKGGAPLPKIIDPVQAFKVLFANLAGSSAAGGSAGNRLAVGKSILDFVRGELGDLKPKLGSEEQQKLDQHLTSLRELEKQLAPQAAPPSSGGGKACGAGATPDPSKFPKLKGYNGGEPYFDAITDAQIDLIANAVACGVTRFATLLMNDLSFQGNPLGLPPDNHGGVAHTYNASPIGNNGRPGNGDPKTWLPLAKLNRYSYQKVARLMQKLDQLGALNDTLIYVSSDMGNPALHSTANVPTLLCGGGGGKFKMGRRIRLGQDCNDGTPWCGPGDPKYVGVAGNHLLVSIAQAFGVNLNTFGSQPDAKHTTGAMSGLG